MARKKASEAVEEIQEVVETPEVETLEEVVEAKPKKSRKKKVEKSVAEEGSDASVATDVPEIVAEPIPEPTPVVEEIIPEAKETPVVEVKPAKVKTEKKIADRDIAVAKDMGTSYAAIATTNLYVLKIPGNLATKLGNFKAGTKFTILEESKGWGKIAEGKWINLNYIEKI